MNPNREELLFQLALSKPAGKRAAWLDAECDGDAAMRQRLDALLAAHEEPDELLATQAVRRDELHESPKKDQGLAELGPPGVAARPTIKLDLADAPDEVVGQTLGRYKLLERVGEGGCGVVYVAEQTEPVRRRVALKVIKLGMDTKQVVARFEAERQALAMPRCARVRFWTKIRAASCRSLRQARVPPLLFRQAPKRENGSRQKKPARIESRNHEAPIDYIFSRFLFSAGDSVPSTGYSPHNLVFQPSCRKGIIGSKIERLGMVLDSEGWRD